MPHNLARSGAVIGRVIVAVILAALVGAAFLLMSQEQQARSAAEDLFNRLSPSLDSNLTIDEVHELTGRGPNATRTPSKHRLVEEYTFKGPIEPHTVYVYYSVAATRIYSAISINQKNEEWESE